MARGLAGRPSTRGDRLGQHLMTEAVTQCPLQAPGGSRLLLSTPKKAPRNPRQQPEPVVSCWEHPSRQSEPTQSLGQTLPHTGSDREDLPPGKARRACGRAASVGCSSKNSQSLAACCSSRPYRFSSGLGIWRAVEADPGLGWPRCRCSLLLFPKTACVPATSGPSSPVGTVPAAAQHCCAAVLTLPFCLTTLSRQRRAPRWSQRVPRREFSGTINQAPQSQAGLWASLQCRWRGRACPCRSSRALGQAWWLWMAQSHEPRCRRAGGENNPVPCSLQPQGYLATSRGSTNPKAGEIYPLPRVTGPGYGPAHPSPCPAATEALLLCAGSAPKQDSVSGGPG